MPAVDTNVLIRLLTRDDPAQVRSAEAFIRGGAWVSHLVLAEATWVLDSVYGLSPTSIATAIEMLLSHRQLSVQESDVVRSAVALFRDRPAVGFSDCLILEVARRAGQTPLGTFDRALAKAPGATRI